MPFLVELKTNLKSLKFGSDKNGNGSSGLPYIQTKIPGVPDSNGIYNAIWQSLQSGNLDFPIRGGQIDFDLKQQTLSKSGLIDYIRIKKFFEDPTRGPSFIRKQIGLQLANPKIETGRGSFFGSKEVPGPIENTRLYNGGSNTLEQVKYAGTGTHAVRHGLVPFSPFQSNYYTTVNKQNVAGNYLGTKDNRLVLLRELKMTENPDQDFLASDPKSRANIQKINDLGISLNRNILFQYLGGPGSVFGVGSTTIFRTEDTAKLAKQNPQIPDKLIKNYVAEGKYVQTENGEIVSKSGVANRLLLLRNMKMVPQNIQNGNYIGPGQEDAKAWGLSTLTAEILGYENKGPGTIFRGADGNVTSSDRTSNFTVSTRFDDTTNGFNKNPLIPEEIRNNYQDYGKYDDNGVMYANRNKNPNETEPNGGEPFLVNRLLLLRDAKLTKSGLYGELLRKKWGINDIDTNISMYQNGPGTIYLGDRSDPNSYFSTYAGTTVIGRTTNTEKLSSVNAMVYSQLAEQRINFDIYKSGESYDKGKRDIQDFRTQLANSGSLTRMGTWEEKDTVQYRFFVAGKNYVDKMNTLYPFVIDNNEDPWAADPLGRTDDTIKFVFEAVSNNSIGKSIAIFFRAYLNGGITDNHGAAWSNFKYMGRGEDFYTYQGFNRSVSFGFKVFAGSEEEMKPMYNRLNALVSQVYPDYSSLGVMRAPIIRLTVGDYLVRMPGILESVNLSVDRSSAWETLSDETRQQLPHAVDVSVSFKPILPDLPRRVRVNSVPKIIGNKIIDKDGIYESADKLPNI